jgi:N-formylglutamate amidohydrolase
MNNSHQDPPPFVFHAGTAPLLVSTPYVGTYLPPAIAAAHTREVVTHRSNHLPGQR